MRIATIVLTALAAATLAGCATERASSTRIAQYEQEVSWYLSDIDGQILPSTLPSEPHTERYRPAPVVAVPARYQVRPAYTAYDPRTGTAAVPVYRLPPAPSPMPGSFHTAPTVVRVTTSSVGPIAPAARVPSGTVVVSRPASYGYVAPTPAAPPVLRASYRESQYGTSSYVESDTQREPRGDTGLAARRTTYDAARSSR